MVAPLGDRFVWTWGHYDYPLGGRGYYFYGVPRRASSLVSGTPSAGSRRLPRLATTASRAPSCPRRASQFHSMNFTIDECSIVTCETLPCARSGPIAISGTRVP